MALITYDDKVALNENPSIPDVNKVNASDMNQIKTGVNTNETNITTLQTTLTNTTTYSTTETVIGTWDDKPLYRKRYDLTTITFGNYATINLDSTYSVKRYEAYIQRSNNRLDKYATGAGSEQASLTSSVRTSGIELWTSNAYSSGFEKVYVIIEYTKIND